MSMAIARPSAVRLARAYFDLAKPRIVMLVVFTGFPALLMAGPGVPEPSRLWGTLLGIALAAGSAACFNNYVDRDIDRLMVRTARRPVPAGVVPASHALGEGFLLR